MELYNNTLKGEALAKRFINSARQMGLTKNKKWLKRLIDKGKILYISSVNGNRYNIEENHIEAFTNRLFELIDVFERKFDNNWDIHVEYHSGRRKYELFFLIHYDKITITNSSNHSRILTDLLVILPIAYKSSTQNVYVRNIQGTRLTLEEDEWYSGYIHSHLPSVSRIQNQSDVFSISNFCIGSEDLSELEIELSVDFDAEKFELMLYTIDSLVAWESIEGGPHKSMRTITSESENIRVTTSNDDIINIYQNLKAYCINNIYTLPLDFVFVDNRYQIKHNDRFVNFIKNEFLENRNLSNYTTYIICKRGTDGYFYTNSQIREGAINIPSTVLQNIKNQMEGELPFVYIQGKKIHFNINFLETTNHIDITEYGVYPKFLTYVSEQLESEIYKACVRGSGINKLSNTSDNVRRNSEENQVLM